MIKLEKRRSSKDCLVEDDDACQARGNQITILRFFWRPNFSRETNRPSSTRGHRSPERIIFTTRRKILAQWPQDVRWFFWNKLLFVIRLTCQQFHP